MFHRVVALSVCALFVVFDFSEGQSAEYEGYRLLSFTVTTAEEADFLRSLGKEYPELDFWLDPVPGLRSVALAPPSILRGVESRLSARRLGFKVETSDVQSLVDAESAPVQARKVYTGETIDHERYHSYESMLTSLRELSRKHPGTMSFSDLPHLTHEGRTVAQVKITSPGSTTNKPTIVIEAGIHSREWVSPAANLYFVEKLLRRYDAGDEKATMMLNKFDWIMVPCVNPDGYEHTRNAYQGRFWRKNRRYVRSHCKGIDLNRNFDFEFGTTGVSDDCSTNIYPGEWGFSEPETANLRDLVLSLGDRLVGYLSVHCYSQYLLTGWSYLAGSERPPNGEELDRVGLLMVASLNDTYSKRYRYGTPYQLLNYAASGSSIDWVLHVRPTAYAFGYELRPDPYDVRGFVLPPEEIVPQGNEYYNSVVTFATEMRV